MDIDNEAQRIIEQVKKVGPIGDFDLVDMEAIRQFRSVAKMFGDDDGEVERDVCGHVDKRVARTSHGGERVPFATFNGDVWLAVDFSPTSKGQRGQVIKIDPEALSWWWLAPSLEVFLAEVRAGRIISVDEDEDE